MINDYTNQKLRFSYKNNFSLAVDIEIPQNQWTIILGENGSGKTTLLKLLAGVLEPESGKINLEKKKIGYIFQNPDDQIIQLSIEKELAFNLENSDMPVSIMGKKIQQYLDIYNFNSRRSHSPNILSRGEKQRLALASTLINDPDILIFDEPTSYLDFNQKELFYKTVENLKKNGKTIIWVTHELDELFFADNILELEKGTLRFWGPLQQYIQTGNGKKMLQESFS